MCDGDECGWSGVRCCLLVAVAEENVGAERDVGREEGGGCEGGDLGEECPEEDEDGL